MYCRITDLIAVIPETDGLYDRCKGYICDEKTGADIIIRTELYRTERYASGTTKNEIAYMEAAYQFYLGLLDHEGFYLHASAVVKDGKAYLFSGPSGIGKSTHTKLWQKVFGEDARIINDDKPALRYIDGCWYSYGTPWCGKDGININERAPLAGVCFLKRGPENKIRHLSKFEAMQRILGQTIYKLKNEEQLDKLLKSIECFIDEIPVYELENIPEVSAVELSYGTMNKGI